MNLDFGILWIEDSYSEEEEQSLRRRVRDAGFIPRIDVIPNGEKIEDYARAHKLFHRFDIILLDYRLQDEDGNELAPRVRELFPSVTILFYSGSAREEELRRMIAEKKVEGVYCVRRDHQRFIERTGELIDQTARALDRLSGMRGLAMRVVAECDELMKKAMLSMSNRDPNCAGKLAELDDDVLSFFNECRASYDLAIQNDLNARLNSRAVDSSKIFKHFRRLTKIVAANSTALGLEQEQVDRLRELRRSSANYARAVLDKRNILGHVFEVQGAEGWVLQGSDQISVSDFPEIRRTFASHIDSFREIGKIVIPLDD
ncbi:response regulator [Agrobacterium tumefaciens]|uniref:response regulator n=1 Tax=Agrobacterium tumefaciens TaxID=358 RepID=UPI001571D2FC|nr:response regulator [Agrobacterium tumefaciens]